MKKLLMAVIALTMTLGTISAQKYMYVWRTDGTHISYLINDLDSIGFYAPSYTLTVKVEGEGTVTGGGTYPMDERVLLTATPAEGYVFSHWSDGETVNPREITVQRNQTLTAVFVDKGSVIPSGMYVVGPATAVESFEAANLQEGMMSVAMNEVTKSKRYGMYEKYIALEADKEFELVYVDDNTIHYGADLKLETPYDVDNGVTIQVYKGELKENRKMKVAKTGFYHIALDQNKVGDLEYPCIVVSPVDLLENGADGVAWQMSNGSRNMTCTSGFNKRSMTWELKNVPVPSFMHFKFRWGNGWIVALDPMTDVRVESNIGQGNKSGSEDIYLDEPGIYDFKLVWTLKGADIEQTLAGSFTRVGDYKLDYSDCEMELVGTAVADQEGAVEDNVWLWGNTYPMGKPQINGETAVWTVEKVKMLPGEYKVRTVNAQPSGGIDPFDNGDNQVISGEGEYKIVFTLNTKTGDKKVEAEYEGEVVEPEKHIITVRAKMPSDWTNTPTAWVWPEGEDGSAAQLTQDGNWWVY
ncbi:MAG: hypothetical protein K5660_05180, partial [Paludibacteraceae bacterium]|nr:hypothetical protein [Paludibacteraceae bacterium]